MTQLGEKLRLRSALYCSAAISVALLATPAFAQDGIEVVTVTAAKREQNVQDVPISMAVIGQKQLEKNNLADLKDITTQVPGLFINRSNNSYSVLLRGFGSGAQNPAQDMTVAMYVDGIFAGRTRQYMAPMFDVQRIEVLRGPQGALLGKNTAAGAISTITNNPTDTWEASVTGTYLFDRSKGVDIYGYVSGPVTDTLNVRFAGKFVDKSGWTKNLANNKEVPEVSSKQGRLTLEFKPSESIQVLTKFQYDTWRQDGRSINGYPAAATRAGVSFEQNVPGLTITLPGLGTSTVAEGDKQNAYHFSNTVNVDFGDVQFVSISGYEAYDAQVDALARHTANEYQSTQFFENFTQGSQEFRVLSPADQTISWIVGIYGDYSNYRLKNTQRWNAFLQAAAPGQQASDYSQSGYAYSAYATATWHATDDLQVILGVRGTQVGKKGTFVWGEGVGGLRIGGIAPFTLGPNQLSEGAFDPSATLQYDLMEDVMVYAAYSRGSKSGTFQSASRAATAANFQLKQETSTNYEIGFKSMWWDWLTVNASAYVLEFKNLQATRRLFLPGNPTPFNNVENVGGAVSQGVEMVVGANLDQWVEGLRFNASGSYMDVHYTDYPGAACPIPYVGVVCTATGQLVANPALLFNGVGLVLPTAPVWSGNYGFTYTRPVFDGLKLELEMTANSASKFWTDSGRYEKAFGLQPGYTKLNFRVGLAEEDDQWSLAVIGRNVTDVIVTNSASIIPGTTPQPTQVFYFYSVEEGRSISVQASVKL